MFFLAPKVAGKMATMVALRRHFAWCTMTAVGKGETNDGALS